jgi:polysaccharide export outer membrane protein
MGRSALLLVVLLANPVYADDYEVGSGDVVEVSVLSHAELSGDFRVDPEGLISFPLLGKLKASGHTAAALEKKLTTLLADGYLKRPQVTVSVKEYGSQKVFVTGEVIKPGFVALKGDRSLFALLSELGALGPNAGHEIIVIRPPVGTTTPVLPPDLGAAAGTVGEVPAEEFGAAEVFRVGMQELLAGNQERNILLQPGDTVFVPRAAQVYVTGSVARPGPYKYQPGMTVLNLLTQAGGVTERGTAGRAKIVRIVGGRKVEQRAKPTDPLGPEDTLVVPEKFF